MCHTQNLPILKPLPIACDKTTKKEPKRINGNIFRLLVVQTEEDGEILSLQK